MRNELNSNQIRNGRNPILSPNNVKNMEATQRTQNNFNRNHSPTPLDGFDTWTGQSSAIGHAQGAKPYDERFNSQLVVNQAESA